MWKKAEIPHFSQKSIRRAQTVDRVPFFIAFSEIEIWEVPKNNFLKFFRVGDCSPRTIFDIKFVENWYLPVYDPANDPPKSVKIDPNFFLPSNRSHIWWNPMQNGFGGYFGILGIFFIRNLFLRNLQFWQIKILSRVNDPLKNVKYGYNFF